MFRLPVFLLLQKLLYILSYCTHPNPAASLEQSLSIIWDAVSQAWSLRISAN